MTLEEKVSLLKQGEETYFEEIYLETNRLVFYVVTRLIKDHDAVKDVVQETYVSALSNIDQLKDNNIQPWLNRIARNKSLDYLKKKRPLLFDDYTPDNLDSDLTFEIKNKDESYHPNIVSEKIETERIIKEIIDDIPEDQRICIMMFYFEELTTREISEQLGISENSVKSRLRYARLKIEDSVREQEKKGVKLYDLSPIAFFVVLLIDGVNTYSVPTQLQITTGTIVAAEAASSSGVATATGGAKAALTTTASKIAITGIATVVTVSGGVYAYNSNEANNISPVHKEEYTIEYGEEFNFETINILYKDVDENIEYNKLLENKEDGTRIITDYEFMVKKTMMTFSLIVQDTQYPELTGQQKYTTDHGVEINYKNITARDVVDGELEVTYEGVVDYKQPDDYNIVASAVDSNGNTSELGILITVKDSIIIEKPKDEITKNDLEKLPPQYPQNEFDLEADHKRMQYLLINDSSNYFFTPESISETVEGVSEDGERVLAVKGVLKRDIQNVSRKTGETIILVNYYEGYETNTGYIISSSMDGTKLEDIPYNGLRQFLIDQYHKFTAFKPVTW